MAALPPGPAPALRYASEPSPPRIRQPPTCSVGPPEPEPLPLPLPSPPSGIGSNRFAGPPQAKSPAARRTAALFMPARRQTCREWEDYLPTGNVTFQRVITRRKFLVGGAALAATACTRKVTPASAPPTVTHGLQVGDVGGGRALVWGRASEASRLLLEWDTTDKFTKPRAVQGPVVTPESGLAATVAIDGLPDGQTIFVRGRFEREAQRGASNGEIVKFQTPRSDKFRLAWTGDTCGQGFGRNPEFGGLVGYKAVREAQPALWVHSGDMIYADN